MNQKGFTLLEITVALIVLTVGATVLWYALNSAGKVEKLNRIHHAANLAARSELEALRGMPRRNIHDTSYTFPGPGGEELRLEREVFDSARMVATLAELTLDDSFSPLELRKPLEVRVRVWQKPDDLERPSWFAWEAGSGWDTLSPEDEAKRGRCLVSLTLKLPEYLWY